MLFPLRWLVFGNVNLHTSRRRLEIINEPDQVPVPTLLGQRVKELLESDGALRVDSAPNFPRDDSGVQIVAPCAPGLFAVKAHQEVEVSGGQVFRFARATM
jgi:hypothetical protein